MMNRTGKVERKPDTPAAAPRSRLRIVRDRIAAHPRIAIAVALVLLAALAWGGNRLSRDYSFRQHLHRAQSAMDHGDYPAALSELGECQRIRPNDPEIDLLFARANWMAGNRAEAGRHLTACKGNGGDSGRITLESQLAAASSGDVEPVEQKLRREIDAGHPERAAILEALVRGLVGRGRAEDAERFATLWVDEAHQSWKPYFYRGVARILLSRDLLSTAHDNAKGDLLHVLELKPDHDVARLLLGNAYVMSGQFKEALPHLEHYVLLKPYDPQGAGELARCRRTLGRPEEARRLLDDWLATHAGTADVFLVRGETALDLGAPEEALDFLRRAQKLAPSNEKIDFAVAATLRALGRVQEAAVHEERWQTRKKLRERLQELEKTAVREPKNVAARHEAGTIALRLDDEPTGMRWLGAVLTIDPAHRPTHEFLADHFEKKGKLDAAAFHRHHAQQAPK